MTAEEVAARHNAALPPKNHNSSGQLRSYVERFVNLADRADELREDTKELAREAKGNGFDAAAIKLIVKQQREDVDKKAKREEREAIVDTYKNALGILD